MLTRFEVENYKGFKDRMVWDLTQTAHYSFGKNLVKNRIVKNAIVYGDNASGKTSLCAAVVDITMHLLDFQKDLTPQHMLTYIGNNSDISYFRYDFVFKKKKIIYEYWKKSNRDLLLEKLYLNNKVVIYHNFEDEKENIILLPRAKNLRTQGLSPHISVIKYIYNNTIVEKDSVIDLLMNYVKGMLYFRSLREANQYVGYKLGGEKLDDIILKNSMLNEFNDFLFDMGLDYSLVPLKLSSGNLVVGAKFDNGNVIPLLDIASSGTRTLMLFYCWLLEFENLTFLVIDEFDAYYHFEVSEKVINIINSFNNLQSMVTTHNVTLLNTDSTRPDCAFIIDKKGVINLCNRTEKELRKNHNIEKMYREGLFNT